MTIAAPSRNGTHHRRLDAQTVRDAARGRWLEILAATDGFSREATRNPGRHGPCPRCGGTDRFRFFGDAAETGGAICSQCAPDGIGDGFAYLQHFSGLSFPAALERVAEYLGIGADAPANDTIPTPPERPAAPVSVQATPGILGAYLRSRGLSIQAPDTLQVAEMAYWEDGEPKGTYPVMLARVQDSAGTEVAKHRTYLAADGAGKATVAAPKKLTRPAVKGATVGGAIRLYPAGDVLAITEGIETALAVREATGTPTWAAISANGLSSVIVPHNVQRVEIWADSGDVGEEAAQKLAARLSAEGREVVVLVPPRDEYDAKYAEQHGDKAPDWLDRLVGIGADDLRQARAEAKPYQRTPEHAEPFEFLDAEAFADATYLREWLVRGVLVRGEPGVVCGPKKSLKTNICVDLAVSLGSATKFLGEFVVPRKLSVAVMSGESGAPTLQETYKRVCKARGVMPSSTATYWCFDLPRISDDDHMSAITEFIKTKSIDVLIIDPAYLALLAGTTNKSASNLFDVGSILLNLTAVCRDTGATVLLVHHTRKNSQADPFAPLELEEMAFSGFAEWARQWLLVNRREPFESGSGLHQLWLHVGGSAGHSGCWAVDIDEGTPGEDFGERYWTVEVARASVAREEAKATKETRKIAEAREKLLGVLARYPEGETSTTLRTAANMSGAVFMSTIHLLIADALAEQVDVQKRGKSYDGYRATGQTGLNRTEPDCPTADMAGRTGLCKSPVRPPAERVLPEVERICPGEAPLLWEGEP